MVTRTTTSRTSGEARLYQSHTEDTSRSKSMTMDDIPSTYSDLSSPMDHLMALCLEAGHGHNATLVYNNLSRSWMDCGNATEELASDEIRVEHVVSVICFGFIGVAGLLGNSLVVLVISVNPSMRSTTNLLIINLAIADILFVLFCVPYTASDYALPMWPFGNLWCKIVQYMTVVTCHASVYTLVLMSLDRFMAVVHPIASMSLRTERNAFISILCIWIVVLVTGLPVTMYQGEREYWKHGVHSSACVFQEELGYDKFLFHLSFFLTSAIIPLSLISILYVGMLLRLWRGAPGCRISAESRKGKRRVTRLVVVVVLVFAICWCPIQIILVLKSIGRYPTTHGTIIGQIVAHVLAYSSSCINPFLYAFLSENFRKSFRKIVLFRNEGLHFGNTNNNQNNGQPTKSTRIACGPSNTDVL